MVDHQQQETPKFFFCLGTKKVRTFVDIWLDFIAAETQQHQTHQNAAIAKKDIRHLELINVQEPAGGIRTQ